jgi:hypothetical protein
MSLEELYEWEAYSLVEPFGCPAEDDRVRLQCSLDFALHAQRGSKEPDWLDRDPEETARTRAKISVADKLEAFFATVAEDASAPRIIENPYPDAQVVVASSVSQDASPDQPEAMTA